MSERSPHRRPQTFKLDDPGVVVMDADEHGRLARGTVRVTPESDPALLPVPIDAPLVPVRRGFRWGTLFWTALAGLVLLGLGLSVTHLIEDLFARNQELGFVGLACWRGWRPSKNCTCARPRYWPATTAPRAAASCKSL
jgi:putative membrane protein